MAVDLKTKGARTLFEYWVHGEGAVKVRWGTDGSMDRCIHHLTGKVRDPGGLCAEYHHAATGEWPRGGTIPSSANPIGFAMWQGLLAPIERPTGDGREFGMGALTHRQLPLPLMWQREMASGTHTGAVIIGLISELSASPDQIYGRGELFNPDEIGLPRLAEDIEEVKFLLKKKVIGPSVDLDSVTFEWRNGHQYILEGRICSATLVPIPAFAEARPFEIYEEGFLIASSGLVNYPFEFISLAEWKSSKHPRDYHGRFRETPDAPDAPKDSKAPGWVWPAHPDDQKAPKPSHQPRHRAATPESRKTPKNRDEEIRLKEQRAERLRKIDEEETARAQDFLQRDQETERLLEEIYDNNIPYEVYRALENRQKIDMPSLEELKKVQEYLKNREGKPLEFLDEDREIIDFLDPDYGEDNVPEFNPFEQPREGSAEERRIIAAAKERAKLTNEEDMKAFDRKFAKDNPDIFPPGADSIFEYIERMFKEARHAQEKKEERGKITSGQSAADEDFEGHISSGVKRASFFDAGMQGQTAVVQFSDGTHAVHKRFPEQNEYNFGTATDQADAEELASVVGQALGVKAPSVYRSDYDAIFMEYLTGDIAESLSREDQGKIFDSDQGRLVGLMDIIIDNGDRHDLNWLIEKDESGVFHPKPIDHGLSFRYRYGAVAAPDQYGGFSKHFSDGGYWKRPNDMSPEDLKIIRERLEKLLPRFKALNREDWHESMMTRLEEVERRARGTRRRVTA